MPARFITRDDMISYVKARLGHPVIDLELELGEANGLGHIHLSIDDSVDWMVRENADESAYHDWMILKLKAGIIEYKVPVDLVDVIDAAPSFGNGFTPWQSFDVGPGEALIATTGFAQFDLVTYVAASRYLADVKKLVGQAYQIHLHPQANIIRVYPTPKLDHTVVVAVYRKAALSEIFGNVLFRDLVVARTKLQWGNNIGKDIVQLPGGGSIAAERIIRDATEELKKAEEAIKGESGRPFIMAM